MKVDLVVRQIGVKKILSVEIYLLPNFLDVGEGVVGCRDGVHTVCTIN